MLPEFLLLLEDLLELTLGELKRVGDLLEVGSILEYLFVVERNLKSLMLVV